MMSLVSVILLLASTSSFSGTVAGQCDYVYIAQPPSPELICDPHIISQLRLVCSIFATDITQPDTLTIQWIYGTPTANGLFDPNNLLIFREANFTVVPREVIISRMEVLFSPPIGFYFCLPRLSSGRLLRRSNIAILQPRTFYQLRNTRPCLPDEFQNTSIPSCAVPGATIDPSQILAPFPTIIETLQFISPTAVGLATPTALLEVQQTPLATSTEPFSDKIDARLIAGVTVGSVIFIIPVLIVILGVVVVLQKARKNNKVEFDKNINDLNEYRINTEQGDEETFVPPNKPPPTLFSHTHATTNHHYNRLVRSRPKTGHSSERSARGSGLDYDDDGIEYYTDFGHERMENPYVDASESLICTDAQYSAESDLHLQQQLKQRKQQSLVRSSSLELELAEESTCILPREEASTMNGTNAMGNSAGHVYQNCIPKSEYHNVRLKPKSEYDNVRLKSTLRKAKCETRPTSYHQEAMDTRELETEYANAEILENTAD